jgi:hypothetical protein
MANCINCWGGGVDPESTECPECGFNPSRRIQRVAARRLLIGILMSACGLVAVCTGFAALSRARDAGPTFDY